MLRTSNLTDTLALCVGLPMISLTERADFYVAYFDFPASLDELYTYKTYGDRLARHGLSMHRWGIDLTFCRVEIYFSETF